MPTGQIIYSAESVLQKTLLGLHWSIDLDFLRAFILRYNALKVDGKNSVGQVCAGDLDVFTQGKRADKLTGRDSLVSVLDRKSTRLNSSHVSESRMPSSA